MLESKLTRHTTEQLKTTIIHQQIMNIHPKNQILTTLHYSLCSKQGHTVSFISNERLIIFDQKQSILYYVNQIGKTPYKNQTQIPKPKKDSAHISMCVARRQHADSNILVVMFNKKIQDGKDNKLQCIQWKFIMANKELAKQWEELIKEKKLERMAKAIGVDTKDKKQLGVISDTLSFGLMGIGAPGDRKRSMSPVHKVEEVDQSIDRKQIGNFFLNLGKQPNKQNNVQKKAIPKEEESEILPTFLLQNSFDLNGNPKKPAQESNKNSKPIINSRKSTPRNSPKNIDQVLKKESPKYMDNKYGQKPYFKNMHPTANKQVNLQSPQKSDQRKSNNSNNKSLSAQSERQELKYSPKQKNRDDDWNYKFLENRTQKIIKDFTQFATKKFALLNIQNIKFQQKHDNNIKVLQPILIKQKGVTIQLAQSNSKFGQILIEQYANYHYILECLKQNSCIGVPLACLIQNQGITCLIKANFPANARKIQGYKLYEKTPFSSTVDSLLKQMQMHTKIQSQIIKKTASYGLNNGLPRIYLDQISAYLPKYPLSPHPKTTPSLSKLLAGKQIRPELILYNFTRIIDPNEYPTQTQTSQQIQYYMEQSLKELVEILIGQQKIFCHYKDLKEIMHYYGINLNALPYLYYIVDIRSKKQSVKHVSKLLQTVMAAMLISKQDIFPTIAELRKSNNVKLVPEMVEGIYRKYCEGKSVVSSESWKKLTSEFKKEYEIALVSHQISGGLLISSLMAIVQGEYDLSKLSKHKKILYDKQVILKGFVKNLYPTVSSYTKYQTKEHEQLLQLCSSKNTDNISKLQQLHLLSDSQKRSSLLSAEENNRFLAYLSKYVDPFQTKYIKLQQQITAQVSKQPPTYDSHYITINCIDYSLRELQNKKQLNRESQEQDRMYKLTIQKYSQIINFWLGQQHPYLSDMYTQLSQYHYIFKQNYQQSIRNLKESLSMCRKNCGPRNYLTASKYKKLGERQLEYGSKRQAKQNLNLAIDIYSDNMDKNIQDLAILCNRIAVLQLSEGNVDACVHEARSSIGKLQKIKSDRNVYKGDGMEYNLSKEDIRRILIDNYGILCRAYEIQQNHQQMRKLCVSAIGKVINEERNPVVFEILLKMSLIAIINGMEASKLGKLKTFMQYSKARKILEDKNNRINGKVRNKNQELIQNRRKLFMISNKLMDKLMKLETVDKLMDEINRNNKQFKPETSQTGQFIQIWQCVVSCIGGHQTIYGVISQRTDSS